MQEVIKSSLLKSFEEYEMSNPEELLQISTIVKLLEFCIETNKTFAVEYNPRSREQVEEQDSG